MSVGSTKTHKAHLQRENLPMWGEKNGAILNVQFLNVSLQT